MSDINKKTSRNIKLCAMAAVICAAIGCTGCGTITDNTVKDISNSVSDSTSAQTTTDKTSTSDTTTTITDTDTSAVTTDTTTDTTTSKAEDITSTADLMKLGDVKKLCDANESASMRYDGVTSDGKKNGGVYFAWKNKGGQYCFLTKGDDGTVSYYCDGMTAMYSDGKESYLINTTVSADSNAVPLFILKGKEITSKATSETDGSTKYVVECQVTQSEAKSLGGEEAGTLTETVTVGKDMSAQSFTRTLSSSSGKNKNLFSAEYTYGDTMPKCSLYEEYNDNPRVSVTVKFTDTTADKTYEIPKGKSFTYTCASGYALRTSRSATTDYECSKALNDNLTLYCVKK